MRKILVVAALLGHQVAKELPGSYTDDAASNAQSSSSL
jgi:hypothetical protein